ncbi:hypothetical protein ACHWQZ_G002317 [Mnemiopsis leidyi]
MTAAPLYIPCPSVFTAGSWVYCRSYRILGYGSDSLGLRNWVSGRNKFGSFITRQHVWQHVIESANRGAVQKSRGLTVANQNLHGNHLTTHIRSLRASTQRSRNLLHQSNRPIGRHISRLKPMSVREAATWLCVDQ